MINDDKLWSEDLSSGLATLVVTYYLLLYYWDSKNIQSQS